MFKLTCLNTDQDYAAFEEEHETEKTLIEEIERNLRQDEDNGYTQYEYIVEESTTEWRKREWTGGGVRLI